MTRKGKVKKMKKIIKHWKFTAMLLMFLGVVTAGCSNTDKTSETEEAPPAVVYPVSIDGSEILIGETTVKTLLDKGLKITVSEMTPDKQINHYEIDPETELEANSYYSGGSIWITDSSFAHISMVTDENNVKMGEAVIAYLEFSLSSQDKTGLDNLLFNGVPVTEISREKAGEMFPDFTGDENMWFSPASMTDYEYFMSFDMDGMLNKFSLKKKYDVDWNSKS